MFKTLKLLETTIHENFFIIQKMTDIHLIKSFSKTHDFSFFDKLSKDARTLFLDIVIDMQRNNQVTPVSKIVENHFLRDKFLRLEGSRVQFLLLKLDGLIRTIPKASKYLFSLGILM
jgi:hypothetical protein